jgi:isoleucyl-tRNA synthetase
VTNEVYATPGIDTAPVSLLARTTTPWTLPSNMFGAVNQDNLYAMIYDLAEQEYFVMADVLVSKYYKNTEDYRVVYLLK